MKTKLRILIEQMQSEVINYLIPDGIESKELISRLIYLLDGPEQRDAFEDDDKTNEQFPTLYSITGNINDINTLLVPASYIKSSVVPAHVAQLSEPTDGCDYFPSVKRCDDLSPSGPFAAAPLL
ncbi:MAG: hypothetical protein V4493_01065 [Pseudomonadota bacterium]